MAPLALLAAVVAVWVVVGSTTGDGGSDSEPSTSTGSQRERSSTDSRTSTGSTGSRTTGTETSAGPRTYTVKSGDTLGSIAEATDVTVTELQELNPDLDPQSLTVGQRIRLRR